MTQGAPGSPRFSSRAAPNPLDVIHRTLSRLMESHDVCLSFPSTAASVGGANAAPPPPAWESHSAPLQRTMEEDRVVITADGELDASNATQFADYFDLCIADSTPLVVDLSGLEFFGTAGFSALHLINVQVRRGEAALGRGAEQSGVSPTPICDPAPCAAVICVGDGDSDALSEPATGYSSSSVAAQRLRQQRRDVHLRDADPLGDLRLRHRFEEPEHQHRSLALGQRLEQRSQRFAILDALQPGVDIAEGVGDGAGLIVAAAAAPAVDGQVL